MKRIFPPPTKEGRASSLLPLLSQSKYVPEVLPPSSPSMVRALFPAEVEVEYRGFFYFPRR